jgi:putative flippase GtrA
MRMRLLELMRFGSVGAVAFVVDAGLFNLLILGPGELLAAKPLTAKVVSATVATVVAFPGRRRRPVVSELVGFVLVNLGGMAIAVACLAVSRYVLGLTSPLADNVAANGVGLVLGTAFRYLAYRWLVFPGPATPASSPVPSRVSAAAGTLSDGGTSTGAATDGVNAVATAPDPRT